MHRVKLLPEAVRDGARAPERGGLAEPDRGEFPNYFPESHAAWAKEQRAARPELDEAAIEEFGRNMWGGDFVFSVSRDFVRRCAVPCLVLPGNDTPHPAVIGAELAELLPNAEQLNPWKGPEHLDEQCERVIGFLEKHTP
jgi:hypothetical protein